MKDSLTSTPIQLPKPLPSTKQILLENFQQESHQSIESLSIDAFILSNRIPLPPPIQLSYGMGIEMSFTPLPRSSISVGEGNLPPPIMKKEPVLPISIAKSNSIKDVIQTPKPLPSLPGQQSNQAQSQSVQSPKQTTAPPLPQSPKPSASQSLPQSVQPPVQQPVQQAKTQESQSQSQSISQTSTHNDHNQQPPEIFLFCHSHQSSDSNACLKFKPNTNQPQNWITDFLTFYSFDPSLAPQWQLYQCIPQNGCHLIPFNNEKSKYEDNAVLMIQRLKPAMFTIRIFMNDEEYKEFQVDLFTSVYEILKQLPNQEGFGLLREVEGKEVRFLYVGETPFTPLDVHSKYIYKSVGDQSVKYKWSALTLAQWQQFDQDFSENCLPSQECPLLKLHLSNDYYLNIVLQHSEMTVEQVLMYLPKHLKTGQVHLSDLHLIQKEILKPQTKLSTLPKDLEIYIINDLKDKSPISFNYFEQIFFIAATSLQDNIPSDEHLNRISTTQYTTISEMIHARETQTFPEIEMDDQMTEYNGYSLDDLTSMKSPRESLLATETTRTVPVITPRTSSMQSNTNTRDRMDSDMTQLSDEGKKPEIVKKTAKLASVLGMTTESEVQELKSRLNRLYGTSTKTITPPTIMKTKTDEEREDLMETKRIGKLTQMLGIQKEKEMALFLEAAGKREREEEGKNKSVQKVAKLLGVTDPSNKVPFRTRRVAQVENLTQFIKSRNTINHVPSMNKMNKSQEDLLSEKSPKSFFGKREQGRKRPNISNGLFSTRVYMSSSQQFKTIYLPVDTTVQKMILLLIEKMNIKESAERYAVFIDAGIEETALELDKKIFDTICDFKDKEYLVFRLKEGKRRESTESTNNLLEMEKGHRRVAKVANIFGINERKNVFEENRPEIQNMMKLMTIGGGSGSMKPTKEGWLMYEDNLGQKQKSRNLWCFIENKQFTAQQKSPNQIILQASILQLTVQKSQQRRFCLELRIDGNLHFFYAESQKSCDDWLDAFQAAAVPKSPMAIKEVQKSAQIVQTPVLNTNNQLSPAQQVKSIVKQIETVATNKHVSMNDFEIHKVLGRGKFGKVLLCSHKQTQKVYAIKVIKKSIIKDERQAQNALTENQILKSLQHPFMVQLMFAFQTPERLHLVLEYVSGGELFFHVNKFGKFDEERVVFYSAEIFSALDYMHQKSIVYRDLKLENILMDREGHVKIADFGLSKKEDLDQEEDSIIAGTFEYLAPEVIGGLSHSYSADWWAFGVVMFEMLCGYHPFYCEDREELCHRIMYLKVDYPEHCSGPAIDLISKLFIRDPERRIGCGAQMGQEIQKHLFFHSIDFVKLLKKELKPPFVPEIEDPLDTAFFDEDFTNEEPNLTPSGSQTFDQEFFEGFSYTREAEFLA